ncbi:MAG TPA: hypothetical protein VF473_02345 [Cyclobacteriaceae bacterium]
MKKLTPLLLLLLLAEFGWAQKIDSLWTTMPLTYEINSLTVAPDGSLIAMTRTNFKPGDPKAFGTLLTGVNSETGAVEWTFPKEFPADRVNINGIDIAPNTPFIIPTGTPLAVIDPMDGRVLVDAVKENIKNIEDYGFLLQSGHAWISGTIDGEKSLSVFDLRTGKKLYSNTEIFKEKNKAAAKLNKLAALTGATAPGGKGGFVKLLCAPINDGKDNMIIATSNGIFHAKIATGQIDWEAELPDINKGKAIKVEQGIDFVKMMPGRGETFFVVKPGYMIAMNYSDGKPAWKDLVKTSGPIDQIIYDQAGLILCPGSANVGGIVATGYIKLVDEKTGSELWGDGIKFNGGVKNYLYTERGLAVAMVNSSNNKNSINFIDVTAGKFVLPKNVTVDGNLEYLELTPKGLLYKTDREVNIIGLETDKRLMDLPTQSKNDMPILSVNGPEHIYFYSDDDKLVYDINKATGTGAALNKEKVDFKNGEKPMFIDLRKNGVFVYSAQNAKLIGLDGTTKYNVYYPGVRTLGSVMNKIGTYTHALAAVAAVAAAGVDANHLSKATVQLSDVLTPAQQATLRNQFSMAQQAYAVVGTAEFITSLANFKNVKSRVSASGQSNDMIYMMTKFDDRTSLLGLNKDRGEAVAKIGLARGDKNPMYELDTESGYLYYVPEGRILGWSTGENSITGYSTPEK